MPKTLSRDLREWIVAYVGQGHSRRSAAAKFAVAPSSAIRLLKRHAETGSVEPHLKRAGRRSVLDKQRDYLVARIAQVPDLTLPELAAELIERGAKVDPSTLSRWFIRQGYTFKKTLLASEQERSDVKQRRDVWIKRRQPRMRQLAHRLVFIDETGTTTKMTRLRGRALKGERLRAKAPFGHWKTQTFIAGLRCDGLTAPFVIDRPMNRAVFRGLCRNPARPNSQQG